MSESIGGDLPPEKAANALECVEAFQNRLALASPRRRTWDYDDIRRLNFLGKAELPSATDLVGEVTSALYDLFEKSVFLDAAKFVRPPAVGGIDAYEAKFGALKKDFDKLVERAGNGLENLRILARRGGYNH